MRWKHESHSHRIDGRDDGREDQKFLITHIVVQVEGGQSFFHAEKQRRHEKGVQNCALKQVDQEMEVESGDIRQWRRSRWASGS